MEAEAAAVISVSWLSHSNLVAAHISTTDIHKGLKAIKKLLLSIPCYKIFLPTPRHKGLTVRHTHLFTNCPGFCNCVPGKCFLSS